jgi:hypothetical protein
VPRSSLFQALLIACELSANAMKAGVPRWCLPLPILLSHTALRCLGHPPWGRCDTDLDARQAHWPSSWMVPQCYTSNAVADRCCHSPTTPTLCAPPSALSQAQWHKDG